MHSDPRPDVVQLFIQPDTQTALSEAIAVEWPAYFVNDCNLILERFADNLWRYRRPVGDGQGFFRWATAWVKRETRRMRFLAGLRSTYDSLLIAAITRGLFMAPEDFAIETEDHVNELILHLLQHPRKIDGLLSPKSGKRSTMLFSLAQSRTKGYRSKLTRRRELVAERLRLGHGIYTEHVSSEPEVAEVSQSAALRQKAERAQKNMVMA